MLIKLLTCSAEITIPSPSSLQISMTLLPEAKVRTDKQRTDVAKFEPSVISCWKKDNAGGDLSFKGYVEQFMNTSMDEHKQCFKNAMKKIVEKTKFVSRKQELESSSATQTTVSK